MGAFTRRRAGADVSLVFYAGHDIERDGVNYVVPVDARLERDTDVRFETVTLDDLRAVTAGASQRLVILDACRNNPLTWSMQRTATTQSVSGGSFGDLNEDLLGAETLVVYTGTTTADGRGRKENLDRLHKRVVGGEEMRLAKLGVILLLSTVLLASASVVLADGRVALVVGNSTYAHIGRLPNPANDAVAVSAALRRLGFEVTTTLDAGLTDLNQALRTFTRHSAGADVALVFYAGHGLEMDGVNYVVPVDARLERDVDVRYETATLEDLVASTLGASLRLVILDACRNNPLARSMQRTVARRSVSGGSFGEFNEDLLGNETLVAYAAAAGTTAADGRGRNSPYTAALLEHLEQPLEIGLMFRRMRARVLAATGGEQRPHEYHSLLGEHYLSVPPTADSVTVVAAVAPVPDAVPVDLAQLDVAQLRALTEQGDARAQTELGERYEEGRGVVQDYEAAVALYRQAAEQGDPRGQGNLGAMYANGWGVEEDDDVGVRWYRRAAEQGNARGQHGLGAAYRDGRGGVPQNRAEAVRWFRLSAEQGDARGQSSLGGMYEDGWGVPQDHVEAVRWYRRAADQGSSWAQGALGRMHELGRGVPEDHEEAVRWYRRAADQGSSWAQAELGRMYERGRGVRRDHVEAARWYRRAAEQGNAYAQNNLGRMYERGRGVRRDRVEAVRWYRLAAQQGNERAKENLDRFR